MYIYLIVLWGEVSNTISLLFAPRNALRSVLRNLTFKSKTKKSSIASRDPDRDARTGFHAIGERKPDRGQRVRTNPVRVRSRGPGSVL